MNLKYLKDKEVKLKEQIQSSEEKLMRLSEQIQSSERESEALQKEVELWKKKLEDLKARYNSLLSTLEERSKTPDMEKEVEKEAGTNNKNTWVPWVLTAALMVSIGMCCYTMVNLRTYWKRGITPEMVQSWEVWEMIGDNGRSIPCLHLLPGTVYVQVKGNWEEKKVGEMCIPLGR